MTPLDDKTREQIVARVLAGREQRPQRLAQMKERQQLGIEVAHECARIGCAAGKCGTAYYTREEN